MKHRSQMNSVDTIHGLITEKVIIGEIPKIQGQSAEFHPENADKTQGEERGIEEGGKSDKR